MILFTAPHPSQHIQFLLGEEDDDEEHKSHDLFCEMGELFTQDDGEMEWKETARYDRVTLTHWHYRKNPKISDTRKFAVITLKVEQDRFSLE